MAFTYTYPRPALTVDALVFRRSNEEREVLLIQRDRPPFEGGWALPGGFVDMDETLEQAVCRELEEETALQNIVLNQLHTFSSIDRDPRGRTISVVFWGVYDKEQPLSAGDDARQAAWFPLNKLPVLAFDHLEVVQMAVKIWENA